MKQTLTTTSVAPNQRIAYWNDMICSTYVELECDSQIGHDFNGSIEKQCLAGLELTTIRSRAQRVMRTPRKIACASEDFFIVSVQTHGQGLVSQDGRDAVISPGDFTMYDSTRPYTLSFENDFEELVLKLPGKRLRTLVQGTENLTATTISGRTGAGRLLVAMAQALRGEIDTLEPASAYAVASGFVNLVVAGLQSLPACAHTELSSMSAYHIARIKHRINERLRDPELTLESIASQLEMSTSHLHRLFKTEPLSPAQYVWNERLEGCSRELLDERRKKIPVAQIAYGWGFSDAAHFSRTFRDRFGCTPTDWRRNAQVVDGSQTVRDAGAASAQANC
ncbi:helix-turn-helix domain-containing protein [Variovorax sp. EBFNA2]|uniref:AraC-like ligand-binding domain-containing protein n=1 Tax=Variovorax sp. EBFNA2 TaxID=3342097 RepID=UPI0029BFDEEC|nr:helix-turn-helix domain-containing protein [Variovorax boronicumulans]WPG41241.1 helix-turn-helix domain-containing protein [Variovorax boronicumulans]